MSRTRERLEIFARRLDQLSREGLDFQAYLELDDEGNVAGVSVPIPNDARLARFVQLAEEIEPLLQELGVKVEGATAEGRFLAWAFQHSQQPERYRRGEWTNAPVSDSNPEEYRTLGGYAVQATATAIDEFLSSDPSVPSNRGGRPRISGRQYVPLLEEFETSGKTQADFAHEKDIPEQTLSDHLKKARAYRRASDKPPRNPTA